MIEIKLTSVFDFSQEVAKNQESSNQEEQDANLVKKIPETTEQRAEETEGIQEINLLHCVLLVVGRSKAVNEFLAEGRKAKWNLPSIFPDSSEEIFKVLEEYSYVKRNIKHVSVSFLSKKPTEMDWLKKLSTLYPTIEFFIYFEHTDGFVGSGKYFNGQGKLHKHRISSKSGQKAIDFLQNSISSRNHFGLK